MDVLAWLLDGDPAIRWQVLADLSDAPADEVAAERARVAREGWGARLLAARDADGLWAHGACFPGTADLHTLGVESLPDGHPWRAAAAVEGGGDVGVHPQDGDDAGDAAREHRASNPDQVVSAQDDPSDGDEQPWTATYPTLDLLRDLGIDPDHPAMRETTDLIAVNGLWEEGGQPFWAGEVEPCINGRTLRLAHYFGHAEHADALAARLVGEQLADGGWNCEAERGSTRSSFHSTLCVLVGLLAHERARGGVPEVQAARLAGEEYLLERRLFRRLSTGAVVSPRWLELSFPPQWHYDVLCALDHFREAGGVPDPRLSQALDVLESKRQPDGRWLLESSHPGATHFDLEDGDGHPSRWNTLRALRVLRWAARP